MKMTRRNFLSASALTLLSCQLAPAARADCLLLRAVSPSRAMRTQTVSSGRASITFSLHSTAQTPPCRRSL